MPKPETPKANIYRLPDNSSSLNLAQLEPKSSQNLISQKAVRLIDSIEKLDVEFKLQLKIIQKKCEFLIVFKLK